MSQTKKPVYLTGTCCLCTELSISLNALLRCATCQGRIDAAKLEFQTLPLFEDIDLEYEHYWAAKQAALN